MKIERILTASAVVLALASAGCQRSTTIDASGGAPREVQPLPELVAQARPPIPDLPVPIGFKLDEDKSRDFAAAGARYVDHVYYGGADRFAVARFYKRQMPIARWTLVTSLFVQGDLMLDFEKETERCRVVISKGGLFHHTEVKVQMWTSGRIRPVGVKRK